ncbi:MAG: type II secretion system protein N [Candidatus Omnitrophota bacterium]
MEKKETAEKKLLKLIESSGSSAEAKTPAASDVAMQVAAAVKETGFSVPNAASFLAPILDLFRGKFSSTANSVLTFGLREANQLLAVIVGGLLIFSIASMVRDTKILEERVLTSVNIPEIESVENDAVPQKKDVSDYLASVEKRNIFQPFEKKPEEKIVDASSGSPQIATIAKNYKLVGISWLDSPDSASALIEDTQSGNTFFLKKGEKISNITIKDIFADRVILTYQGEDVAIKL